MKKIQNICVVAAVDQGLSKAVVGYQSKGMYLGN